MKISKRSNGVYQVAFRLSDGVRRRVGLATKDANEAHAKAVLVVAEAKRATGDHDWTLGDALMDTYDRVWEQSKSSYHIFQRLRKLDRLGLFGATKMLSSSKPRLNQAKTTPRPKKILQGLTALSWLLN